MLSRKKAIFSLQLIRHFERQHHCVVRKTRDSGNFQIVDGDSSASSRAKCLRFVPMPREKRHAQGGRGLPELDDESGTRCPASCLNQTSASARRWAMYF